MGQVALHQISLPAELRPDIRGKQQEIRDGTGLFSFLGNQQILQILKNVHLCPDLSLKSGISGT